MFRCPGQDMRNWGPDAIFDVTCPSCSAAVEFFKDEVKRTCPSCGRRVVNDRMDLGCAEWCPAAADCLEGTGLELTSEQRQALKRAFERAARGER